MIYTIGQQFIFLSISLVSGLVLAFVFDVVYAWRALCRSRKKWFDLLLWLIFIPFVFVLWMILAQGALRLSYLLWLFLGFVLYYLCLGRPVYEKALRHLPEHSPYFMVISLAGKGDHAIELFFLKLLKFLFKSCLHIKNISNKKFLLLKNFLHKKFTQKHKKE